MFAFLILPSLAAWTNLFTCSITGYVTNSQTGVDLLQTNKDTVFSVSNYFVGLPVYTFSPAPSRIVTSSKLTVTGSVVYPFSDPGNEIVTPVSSFNGREVGRQFMIPYPPSSTVNFTNFIPGTLAEAIWTNTISRTNSAVSQIWSSRALPPAAASWNPNSLIKAGTNYTGYSYGSEMESSAGQFAFTAFSPRLCYVRGHGAGAPGTNTVNAGKQVWFLTAGNATITNYVVEQVTSLGTDTDFTLFLLQNDLPASITPFPVASVLTYILKSPVIDLKPRPNFAAVQGNKVSCGLPPFLKPEVTPGDSGLPAWILKDNRLIWYQGASTASWNATMANCAQGILERAGLPLTYMPEVIDFEEYPDFPTGL